MFSRDDLFLGVMQLHLKNSKISEEMQLHNFQQCGDTYRTTCNQIIKQTDHIIMYKRHFIKMK